MDCNFSFLQIGFGGNEHWQLWRWFTSRQITAITALLIIHCIIPALSSLIRRELEFAKSSERHARNRYLMERRKSGGLMANGKYALAQSLRVTRVRSFRSSQNKVHSMSQSINLRHKLKSSLDCDLGRNFRKF